VEAAVLYSFVQFGCVRLRHVCLFAVVFAFAVLFAVVFAFAVVIAIVFDVVFGVVFAIVFAVQSRRKKVGCWVWIVPTGGNSGVP